MTTPPETASATAAGGGAAAAAGAAAATSPLVRARHRDVQRRSDRVEAALAAMSADGDDITVSAAAARAGVHRSFIHRHPELHARVLQVAATAVTTPAPAATTLSHRSVIAENANLHAQTHRQAAHIRALEDRLSELLGQASFARSGLGAPTDVTELRTRLDQQAHELHELARRLEERDDELAAARETNRRLMTQLNQP